MCYLDRRRKGYLLYICLPLCSASFVPNQSVRSQFSSNLRCALVDKSRGPWMEKRGHKAEIESRILTEVSAGVSSYARSRSPHEIAHRHIHFVDI